MNSKRKTIVLLASVGSAIIAGAIIWFTLFERAEKTILNANPFPCAMAVKYEAAPNDWKTVGWMQLAPGERKTVSATFYRVKPQFFVSAESRVPGLLKWLSETDDGVIHFKGDEAISGNLPKNRDIDLEQQTDSGSVELEEVKFGSAAADEELHILTVPLFHDAILRNEGAEVANEEEGFALIREKAANLFESLHRQKRFEETFKSEKDFPFAFEFNMKDDDEHGFMYLGVTLTDVRSHTLHGDEIKLRNGDMLIGVGSGEEPVTPVYAPADAYLALHEHALDTEKGGITKPLTFVVMREKELLQIESYYLFNPAFDWEEISAVRAFFENGLNSLALGLLPKILGLLSDDPKAAWKKSQQLYRMKQFYPRASAIGDIAGILVPIPIKILNLGKLAKGGQLLSSSVVRGISIELLRVAIYTYNTSVPAPRTKMLTLDDIRNLFPAMNVINFVSGVYKNNVEPTFKLRKRAFGRMR